MRDREDIARPGSATTRRALAGMLLVLGALAAGCAGRRAAPSACPPCPPAPPPRIAPAAPAAVADALFAAERYEEAAAIYEALVVQDPAGQGADHALFRLALARLSVRAEASAGAARAALRRLVDEHPDSPYRPAAQALLDWRAEADRLRGQIEELKRIDLRRPDDQRR